MKKLSLITSIGLLSILLSANSLHAQSDSTGPKPLIIQTQYIHITKETKRVNLDSLLKIWKERVMDPNPYFTSTKIVQHWWGHDSRQVIFIFELNSWDDIQKSFNKRNEIFKDHKGWATEDDLKAFGKLWRSVFRGGHHSDEIYSVVAE